MFFVNTCGREYRKFQKLVLHSREKIVLLQVHVNVLLESSFLSPLILVQLLSTICEVEL